MIYERITPPLFIIKYERFTTCTKFISVKHGLSFVQLRSEASDILSSTVNASIVRPLSQERQTDTAFGSDSLSCIMYCKWIKLMHPSPFCCRTVFISLIYDHKSYSVSQLHLLCGWPSEKCEQLGVTARLHVWWTDMCGVLSSSVWPKRHPVSVSVFILLFFLLYHLSRCITEKTMAETLP